MRWHLVADEFSWQGWRHEGASRIRGPEAALDVWQACVRNPPESDLLLIESVWSDFQDWNKEQMLSGLIRAFHRSGTRVVFWNKEDPAHFERFLPIALKCDVILTTDAPSRLRYRQAGFSGLVEVLTFVAQPAIHRRYYPKTPGREVFFGGGYRTRYVDRLRAVDYLLRPALALGCVDIFARKSVTMGRHDWPAEFQPFIIAELPYLKFLRESSRYRVGLSISSIADSPTMFPRRVVEMPLAEIIVLSDNNKAVKNLFPEVPVVRTARQAHSVIRHYLRDERERNDRVCALRERILASYTYSRALQQIRSLLP